jgi:hypothetical protein
MSYSAPRLDGHCYLHRGRRFYVFKIDAHHPFQGYEAHAQVVVYDKRYGEVVAFCDPNLNGYIAPGIVADSIEIYGINPKALVQDVKRALAKVKKDLIE